MNFFTGDCQVLWTVGASWWPGNKNRSCSFLSSTNIVEGVKLINKPERVKRKFSVLQWNYILARNNISDSCFSLPLESLRLCQIIQQCHIYFVGCKSLQLALFIVGQFETQNYQQKLYDRIFLNVFAIKCHFISFFKGYWFFFLIY